MTDITTRNFEADLIEASFAQPVLLDVWAPWCGPCKTLGPVLEALETEYAGRFKLAKINADDEPDIAGQLGQMFGVRSIPLCVLFKDGQPVDGFVGALPAAQVRAFLDRHVPSAAEATADAQADEARDLLAEGDDAGALARLADAVATDPANDTARYDYLKALLAAGRLDEAKQVYAPVAGQILLDPRLAAAGAWIDACETARTARTPAQLDSAIAADRRDFAARFELAQTHFAAGRWTEAMDALLEIILRDKAWRDEAARKAYVAILTLMTKAAPKPAAKDAAAPQKGALEVAGRLDTAPADPVVDAYRRKLSMALF